MPDLDPIFPMDDMVNLWERINPSLAGGANVPQIRLNKAEAQRFSDYMTQQSIELKTVLESLAERARVELAATYPSQDEVPSGVDEKWGPNAFACGACINRLLQ